MKHRDAIDVTRAAKTQISQIQDVGSEATELFEQVRPLIAKNATNEIFLELIVPRRHWCMRRENTFPLQIFHVFVGDFCEWTAAHARFQQGNGEQGSVAFVYVVVGEILVAERSQHFDAADAQGHFLAKTVARVSAVEILRYRLVELAVLWERRVEEIDGHNRTTNAVDRVSPCAEDNLATFDDDCRASVQRLKH